MDILKNTKLADLKFIAVQLLYIMTFGMTSYSKWIEEGVPQHFVDRFSDTVLSILPGGMFFSFYTVAIAETFALALFLISVFKMEWLSESRKIYLESGLVLSLFIFLILGFGLRLAGEYGGAADLFFYFGVTLIALYIVEKSKTK